MNQKTLNNLIQNANPTTLINRVGKIKDFNLHRLKLDDYPELRKIENKVGYVLIADFERESGRLIINLLDKNKECLGESIFIDIYTKSKKYIPLLTSIIVEEEKGVLENILKLCKIILVIFRGFLFAPRQNGEKDEQKNH